jgi:hypothetical protein
MENIEKALICSVLMSDFSPEQKQILDFVLDPDLFTHGHNRLFVKSINRLKELDLPVEELTLHVKLKPVMTMQIENELIDILTQNPFGTINTFKAYYDMLKEAKYEQHKARVQL